MFVPSRISHRTRTVGTVNEAIRLPDSKRSHDCGTGGSTMTNGAHTRTHEPVGTSRRSRRYRIALSLVSLGMVAGLVVGGSRASATTLPLPIPSPPLPVPLPPLPLPPLPLPSLPALPLRAGAGCARTGCAHTAGARPAPGERRSDGPGPGLQRERCRCDRERVECHVFGLADRVAVGQRRLTRRCQPHHPRPTRAVTASGSSEAAQPPTAVVDISRRPQARAEA